MTEDLDDIFRLYESAEVTRYMEALFSQEEEKEYIRSYYKCVYCFWGFGMWLIQKKDGTVIGRAGLEVNEEGEYMLGYMLAPDFWHQGYAYEACQGIICYAGEKLNLEPDRIIARIHPKNRPSLKLAKKLGVVIRTE